MVENAPQNGKSEQEPVSRNIYIVPWVCLPIACAARLKNICFIRGDLPNEGTLQFELVDFADKDLSYAKSINASGTCA